MRLYFTGAGHRTHLTASLFSLVSLDVSLGEQLGTLETLIAYA